MAPNRRRSHTLGRETGTGDEFGREGAAPRGRCGAARPACGPARPAPASAAAARARSRRATPCTGTGLPPMRSYSGCSTATEATSPSRITRHSSRRNASALAQALHPGGDGGRGDGALGGQPAPDQGVEDGQRQFHRVAIGPREVEEGADGLLRKPYVAVGGERHDGVVGDGRGEERKDHLRPTARGARADRGTPPDRGPGPERGGERARGPGRRVRGRRAGPGVASASTPR